MWSGVAADSNGVNFNTFMWRIESGLGISIFFNCQLLTIGWNPLMYSSLPHFPHTKNMAFQHTFYAMRKNPHMWCFPINTITIKCRIAREEYMWDKGCRGNIPFRHLFSLRINASMPPQCNVSAIYITRVFETFFCQG